MKDKLVFMIDLLTNILFLAIIISPAFSSNYLSIMLKIIIFHIVLGIIRFVLTKLFKANGDTIFEQKKFNVVANPILLLMVITVYLLFKEMLSIFYLLTFGGLYLTRILNDLKKKTPANG